jgi:small nuclear ribonucleoprotein (snRNP)-like protein
MLAYDKHMNFVLAECEEFRTVKVGPISRNKEEGGGSVLIIYRAKRQKTPTLQKPLLLFSKSERSVWSF